MAHQVEQMMFVGDLPWHGLGTPFEEPPTIEEAIVAAGLDWDVKLKDLAIVEEVGGKQVVGETVRARATVRSTDNSTLGVVGMRYKPLQNKDAFQFFQPFLDAEQASLHTAGSLQDGKRVWILAKLERENSVIVPGDEVSKFLLLSHSHDGSLAIQVGFTPIRVVCANTLAMAHQAKTSKLIRLKHTAKAKENLGAIRETMDLANAQFEATADQFRNLASRSINTKDLEKYIKICIGQDDKKEGEISTKSLNIMNDIKGRFEQGKGNDLKGVRGTWWAAYNAVTEHLSWERGRNQESRMNQLWFGTAAGTNAQALTDALKLSA